MNTIFDESIQKNFRQRLERLEQKATGHWGKMSSAQMLAHCTQALKMCMGEIQIKPHPLRFIGRLVKKKVLQGPDFRKNSPTAREFVMSNERDFEKERNVFLDAFNRLAEGPSSVKCFKHPFFGNMTIEEWGILTFKHLDHHFRQFGV